MALLREPYFRYDVIKSALITRFVQLIPPIAIGSNAIGSNAKYLKEFYSSFEPFIPYIETMKVCEEEIFAGIIKN